jgi:hypothetical protein
MKKAGDLLTSFFDERLIKTAREYSELFSSWQSIAGEKIADHSRIRELERSILLVEADHPGWIQILQTREKDLLNTIQRRFPEQNITGISFRLSRDPGPGQLQTGEDLGAAPRTAAHGEEPRLPDTVEGSDAAPGEPAGDPYGKIEDEHFRETLKRLEESIISKNKA